MKRASAGSRSPLQLLYARPTELRLIGFIEEIRQGSLIAYISKFGTPRKRLSATSIR
jgi:hypothetical protein